MFYWIPFIHYNCICPPPFFFFFAQRSSPDPLSMQTRPTLFLEGSCRRFIMSWNTEPEQRTTESLTLSPPKKPENFRVSLFLPNSRAALGKTVSFRAESVLCKCKKIGAHIAFYHIERDSYLEYSKIRLRIFSIKISAFVSESRSLIAWH